jgi:hypothetical protein
VKLRGLSLDWIHEAAGSLNLTAIERLQMCKAMSYATGEPEKLLV